MLNSIHFSSDNEFSLVLTFGTTIDLVTHKTILHVQRQLENNPFPALQEIVPSYTTLTIYFDPLPFIKKRLAGETTKLASEQVQELIQHLLLTIPKESTYPTTHHEIPVFYGGTFGPDLQFVSDYTGLSTHEIIQLHSEPIYTVYMLGFSPGFPFLGGMNEQLATPRKETPRLTIPAGSVGIAGVQTGIYPLATPGGWQLIGQSPIPLFTPHQTPPTLLQAGDTIQFIPTNSADWLERSSQ